mmetsp:Transcript_32207/g.73652  ORF Transcript_32207/g.73652 Transcript_32207/m.73652 type:complete len:1313 (+) Transcript_32207:87-4025(+)
MPDAGADQPSRQPPAYRPPTLARSQTTPAGTIPQNRRGFLVERIASGQQPLSETMLLRITGDKSHENEAGKSTAQSSTAQSSDPAPPQASGSCPFWDLGSNFISGSFGRSKSPPCPVGRCEVCYEERPLPTVCQACPIGKGACAECLCTYFTTAVNDALYAVPKILCLLCRARIETSSWASYVDAATHEKYLANANALLSLRCPSCDDASSFFLVWSSDAQLRETDGAASKARSLSKRRAADLRAQLKREELWGELLEVRCKAARQARRRRKFAMAGGRTADFMDCDEATVAARTYSVANALVETWNRFRASEASADELVAKMMLAWPPGRGMQPPRGLQKAMQKGLPGCIEDPERRLTFQLAWLRRYPKVTTPCCRAHVCFKCKVRGWHRGLSCEERQRREAGREAQFCPNCNVPTTRSDGCDHIRCVCGAEWTWQEREDGEDGDDAVSESSEGSMGESSRSVSNPDLAHHRRMRSALELAVVSLQRGQSAGTSSTKALEALIEKVCSKQVRGKQDKRPPGLHLAGVGQQALQVKDEHAPAEADMPTGDADPASSSSSSPENPPEPLGQESSTTLPPTLLPLRLAVRCGSVSAARLILAQGASISEEVLWEMVRLPDVQSQEMFEGLKDYLPKIPSGALPLWARIQLGLPLILKSDTIVCVECMTVLRRLPDQARRQEIEIALRKQLSDEWFDALQAQAATNSLLIALRWMYKHKVNLQAEVIDSLLELGADPMVREVREQEDDQDEDEEPDSEDSIESGRESSRSSEEQDDEDEINNDEHYEQSLYWCPHDRDPLTALDLVARSAHCPEHLCRRFLVDIPATSASSAASSSDSKVETKKASTVADRRRERLLVQAIQYQNLNGVAALLRSWRPGAPLPPPVWIAFSLLAEDEVRVQIENQIIAFIEGNGLSESQVPLWALIQLCTAPEGDGSEVQKAMFKEAKEQLQAVVGSSGFADENVRVFLALLRGRDPEAKVVLNQLIQENLSSAKKYRTKAANIELLLELRSAWQGRRPPEKQKAMMLLKNGAEATAGREWSQYEDPWNQNSTGFQRGALELLVSNTAGPEKEREDAVLELCRMRANPNGRTSSGYPSGLCAKPLQLAVRARNIPAVRALLESNANLTTKVLEDFRRVSHAPDRHQLEEIFFTYVQNNHDALKLQEDTGVWAAVQSGCKGVAQKAIEDGADIDVHVLIALRRCQQVETREALERVIISSMPTALEFESLRKQAATKELFQEFSEAVAHRRDADEALVQELLELGADPQVRGVDLSDSDIDEDEQEYDDEYGSEDDHSSGHSGAGSADSMSFESLW